MKKFLSTLLLLLISTITFAQDVIVKKDGSSILAKVIKVSSTEVEYKKHSNQNGPTYTINISDLMAINYENGDCDKFGDSKESKNDIVEINTTSSVPVVTNPKFNGTVSESTIQLEIEERIKKGRNLKTGGLILYCVGMGAAVAAGGFLYDSGSVWVDCLLGLATGAPLIAGGLVLDIVGTRIKGNAEATIRKKYQVYDSAYFKNVNNIDKILQTKDKFRVSLSYAVRF